MMSPARAPAALTDALDPVRRALVAAARSEAERIRSHASQTARDLVRRAQAQASEIRSQARARGAAESAELIAAQRSRAARQARAIVLAAERAEYEALRSAARQAVVALRDEPDYQFVRRRMDVVLRRLLGDEAQLHDANEGGVVATAPGRTADLSLARLADRAVDTVVAEDPQLWSGATR
jgi:vacuolar-type H+-ATPase subunit E/Vma4